MVGRRRLLMGAVEIPSEYSLLDYIECRGNGYIETEIFPHIDPNIIFTLDVQFTELGNGKTQVNGIYNGDDGRLGIGRSSGNYARFDLGTNLQYPGYPDPNKTLNNERHTLCLNISEHKVKIDDEETVYDPFTFHSQAARYSCVLIGARRIGFSGNYSQETYCYERVYGAEFVWEGKIFSILKPVKSKYGGKLGLYDTVQKKILEGKGTWYAPV